MIKLHNVYFAIKDDDKPKVGVSQEIKRRFRNENYKEIRLLESYLCPKIAGDREIELQLLYFGERDSKLHYTEMLKISSKTPKGKNVKQSKLNEEQVNFIKNNHFRIVNQYQRIPDGKYSTSQLKKMFNISKKQIQNIINGYYWK